MIPIIIPILSSLATTITKSMFPDKVEIAKAMASSDSKTSAAEIQDLMSGASKWRKYVAYISMVYFVIYCSLYYLVPQALHLLKKDDYWTVMETDGHIHSMYISAGIVLVAMIGREVVKLVRAWRG